MVDQEIRLRCEDCGFVTPDFAAFVHQALPATYGVYLKIKIAAVCPLCNTQISSYTIEDITDFDQFSIF